jgi:tetratricopeptide (TPR) repeat protein
VLQSLRGNVQDALQRAEELAVQNEQLYHFTLAQIHQHASNLSASLAALEKCEQTAAVLALKGKVLHKKGLAARALEVFDQALERKSELEENDVSRLQCQAAVLRAELKGQHQEAMELLRQRLTNNVRDDQCWLDLAVVQGESGNWEDALQSCEQCLELREQRLGSTHPATLVARNQKALSLFGQKRFKVFKKRFFLKPPLAELCKGRQCSLEMFGGRTQEKWRLDQFGCCSVQLVWNSRGGT